MPKKVFSRLGYLLLTCIFSVNFNATRIVKNVVLRYVHYFACKVFNLTATNAPHDDKHYNN